MKVLIFSLMISSSIYAKAVSQHHISGNECADCKSKTARGMAGTDGELDDMEQLVASIAPPKKITTEREEKLEKLARKICKAMKYSDEVFVKRAMSVTTKFLRDDDETVKVTNKKILSFLNENRSYLFCKDREGERIHYMEYALNKHKLEKVFTEFLNELMPGSDGIVPNVNVMIAPNKTLLDAMAEKVKEYSGSPGLMKNMESEIREFRRDYQAKYYSELEAEQKAGSTVAKR